MFLKHKALILQNMCFATVRWLCTEVQLATFGFIWKKIHLSSGSSLFTVLDGKEIYDLGEILVLLGT